MNHSEREKIKYLFSNIKYNKLILIDSKFIYQR
jgi:hypothetical protein